MLIWLRKLATRLKSLAMLKPLQLVINKRVTGTGNEFSYGASRLTGVVLDIVGNQNSISIKDGCTLNGLVIRIRGDNHKIVIENGVRIESGTLWFEDHGGALIVGANTTFEGISIAVTEPFSRVDIGEDCMFSYDIDIRTGDSHSVLDLKTMKRLNFAKNVCIDRHVWVAAHCKLLKGVHISEGSVVATGSCVTKDFKEPNVVLAGNPARVVKRAITWSRDRKQREDVHLVPFIE